MAKFDALLGKVRETDNNQSLNTFDSPTFVNGSFTGSVFAPNITVARSTPELRLTDTGSGEYARFDRSNSNNQLIAYNRVYTPGGATNCIRFNGAQADYGNFSSKTGFTTGNGSFSISCWFNTEIISHATIYPVMFFQGAESNNNSFYFINYAGTNKIRMEWWGGVGAVVSTTVIATGTWYHIVGTYNGAQSKIYINGSLENTTNYSSSNLSASFAELGNLHTFAERSWKGKIEELKYYNYHLSQTEVTTDYNAGAGIYGTSGVGLVSAYHFDESAGTAGSDYVQSNHIAMTGSYGWETGFINSAGVMNEDTLLVSQDGVNANEQGVMVIGHSGGRTVLNGQTLRFCISGTEYGKLGSTGIISFGTGSLGVINTSGLTVFGNVSGLNVYANTSVLSPTFSGTNFYANTLVQAPTHVGATISGTTLIVGAVISGNNVFANGSITSNVLSFSTGSMGGTPFQARNIVLTGSIIGNSLIIDSSTLVVDSLNHRVGVGTASPQTALDINGTTTTNSLIVDGVTLNTVIVDTTTLIVDAMSHNVGIGTATPAYKLTVQGGAVDFFGGYFHCDGTTGMTTLSELTVNNNAGISTANITTGNITTINATTGNIVTISATTVGTNTVNADEVFVSKNQNAATQLHINNTTAGTDAVVGVIMGTDDTAELNLVVTSSLFTGFPNAAALTVNAEGGLYIENTLGDIIIEPLQEADGNGFNVNITASDGFDSGATARDGGNIILTPGLAVNGGIDGGVAIATTPSEKLSVGGRIRSTNSDIVVEDNARGIILKDTQGTPHYWRITVTTSGVLQTADLGTSLPTE